MSRRCQMEFLATVGDPNRSSVRERVPRSFQFRRPVPLLTASVSSALSFPKANSASSIGDFDEQFHMLAKKRRSRHAIIQQVLDSGGAGFSKDFHGDFL